MNVDLARTLGLADSLKVAFNNHMARRTETIISSLNIPDRPGWVIETVIDKNEKISVIVRHPYSRSGWQIATLDPKRGLEFDRGFTLSTFMTEAEMMAHFTLSMIAEKDGPSVGNTREEAKKPFWQDYVNELPNVLITAQVLMQ